jgi:hypothetical protein
MDLFDNNATPKLPKPGKSLINTMLINIYLPILYLLLRKARAVW